MNNRRVREDECGAIIAIATLSPSSFAASRRPPATAGNTVAPGPRWDENRPGMFRVALFRDERASENRVEAHPTAPLSGSSVAYRLFNRGPCDGYRGPPSFAHEPLEL